MEIRRTISNKRNEREGEVRKEGRKEERNKIEKQSKLILLIK